jgi:DNA-binding transcriptional MocR family regulator
LPGGADSQFVEPDGLTFVDARYVIETEDGIRIGVRNQGIRHGSKDKSDIDAALQARKFGLEVEPLSAFTVRYERPPALMLGFAGCNPAELRRGVSVLATALRSR